LLHCRNRPSFPQAFGGSLPLLSQTNKLQMIAQVASDKTLSSILSFRCSRQHMMEFQESLPKRGMKKVMEYLLAR
jgi:hypothetical protein